MAQNPSPPNAAPAKAQPPKAQPPKIVGTSQPAPQAAPKPQLVALQCNEAYSHMWGEPTQTSAGQAHVASDGTLLEPPGIAAALLEVRVPIDGTETAIFTVQTTQDLQLVKDYLAQKHGAGETGEELGRLVYIECQTLAGESTQVEGTKIHFDASGLAVVGERIYQKMRPAFGGDGAIPESQNPAHLLFFKGAITSSDATSEELESAFSPDWDATLDGDLDEIDQDKESLEAKLQLGVEVEDTDLTPPAEQLTPAAQSLADFNAAPPITKPATVAPVADATPAETNSGTQSDTESTFIEKLGRAIGSNQVKVLTANKLGDEAALRAADRKTLVDLKGIAEPTVVKIEEFLKTHPAQGEPAQGEPAVK